jgi:C4-dicarboxylate transporter DctM subunit
MIPYVFIIFFVLGAPLSIVILVAAGSLLYSFTMISFEALVQQLFNGLENFVLLAIPFFILAGNIMAEGAIGKQLIEFADIFVHRLSGGLAIAAIIACAFVAAISGSSLATAIAVGSIAIPALARSGYSEKFAGGLITSAGSLGILIPPSVPMILYCVVMEVSVRELFAAGLLPGIMIAFLLSLYCWVIGRKNNWTSTKRMPFDEIKIRLRKSIWAVLFPVVVLGSIYSGIFTPTEASGLAVVYVLVIEIFVYKSMKIKDLIKVLKNSVLTSGALCFLVSCAMAFTWVITVLEIPLNVANFINSYVTSKWSLLLLINLVLLITGSFMEIISVMLIVAPLLAILLQRYEVNLIHFGIIMIVNSEIGFMSPPFGLNLFAVVNISNIPYATLARSVIPFLLIFLLSLMMLTYFPDISLILPKLIIRI